MSWKTTFSNIFVVVTVLVVAVLATSILAAFQVPREHVLKSGPLCTWLNFWSILWFASFVGHIYQSFTNIEWFRINPQYSEWFNEASQNENEIREFTQGY